jgi:hypothetical protein
MMNMNTYRVLSAMLKLPVFTVADVAKLAAVPPATVRTVLHRRKEIVTSDHAPLVGEAKVGGRQKIYRIKPGCRGPLAIELGELIDSLASTGAETSSPNQATASVTPRVSRLKDVSELDAVPAALLSAEEELLSLRTFQDVDARNTMLRGIGRKLDAAEQFLANSSSTFTLEMSQRLGDARHKLQVEASKVYRKTNLADAYRHLKTSLAIKASRPQSDILENVYLCSLSGEDYLAGKVVGALELAGSRVQLQTYNTWLKQLPKHQYELNAVMVLTIDSDVLKIAKKRQKIEQIACNASVVILNADNDYAHTLNPIVEQRSVQGVRTMPMGEVIEKIHEKAPHIGQLSYKRHMEA